MGINHHWNLSKTLGQAICLALWPSGPVSLMCPSLNSSTFYAVHTGIGYLRLPAGFTLMPPGRLMVSLHDLKVPFHPPNFQIWGNRFSMLLSHPVRCLPNGLLEEYWPPVPENKGAAIEPTSARLRAHLLPIPADYSSSELWMTSESRDRLNLR